MVKKVVAIETSSVNGITRGIKYPVLRERFDGYYIINDEFIERFVLKERFKPLEEEMDQKFMVPDNIAN